MRKKHSHMCESSLVRTSPHKFGLVIWESKVYVHTDKQSKLAGHVRAGYWVGWNEDTEDARQSKGHQVYWRTTRTVTVEWSVILAVVEVDNNDGNEGEDDTTNTDNVPTPSHNPNRLETQPRHNIKPSQYTHNLQNGLNTRTGTGQTADTLPPGIPKPTLPTETVFVEKAMAADMADAEGIEPQSITEAKRLKDWPKWERAVEEELQNLMEHGTWEVIPKLEDANVVGCKWVFKIKKDENGAIAKYKAQLIAQGFMQEWGVNYTETYTPVTHLSSIRLALTLTTRYDYEIHQVNVKGAYLNGDLLENEQIYLKHPPGYPLSPNPSKTVPKLKRPIYGLKQGGRYWYMKFEKTLKELLNMKRCDVDQAVFYRQENGQLIIIIASVDDLTIVASSPSLIEHVKVKLCEAFTITNMGDIHWILGIQVTRDCTNRTLSLSQ